MRPWIFETSTFFSPARTERESNTTRIRMACFIVARASCLCDEWASSPFFETDSTGETPIGPTGKMPVLLQDRVGRIENAVRHHAVDVRGVLDIVERVR